MPKNEILKVCNLQVSFYTQAGIVNAVRGIDFQVNYGETFAIVGESGSGKTVTAKTILRLLAKNGNIDSGEIIYNDIDVLKLPENEMCNLRGSEISMVFQDPMSSLNPVMRVGNQITEVLILKHQMPKRDAKHRALQLIQQVGINEPEKRFKDYPFQFSGGMRQRIVIAIALAQNPKLLICDEPTTALDVTIQAQVLELLADIKKQNNLSVIFITHDLGVVANVADRVCVMYGGKIVEIGTTEEIFYDPRHPYTWSLLASMPDLETSTSEKLLAIPGAPPNMLNPPKGDAFAERNKYAMKIDYLEEPPMFKVTDTHHAATWLLHPNAPKCEIPDILKNRIANQKMAGGL